MKPSIKVFIMTVVSFLISTVATLESFNIWFVVLTTAAFAGEYAAKNYWFPSTSPAGQLYWKDILSGLFLALLTAVNGLAASLITGVEFTGQILWVTVIGAIVAYFTKTVSSGVKA